MKPIYFIEHLDTEYYKISRKLKDNTIQQVCYIRISDQRNHGSDGLCYLLTLSRILDLIEQANKS